MRGDYDASDAPSNRANKFDLSQIEGTNFDFSHRHSGLQGDGQQIKLANTDTTSPFQAGSEPIYIPVNATTSGRKYRIQIIEVTDPDTQVISAVLQVVPA